LDEHERRVLAGSQDPFVLVGKLDFDGNADADR
jgi:hypothetical protein